jgi:hypothetical protein
LSPLLVVNVEDLGNAGSGITDGEVDSALDLVASLHDQVVDGLSDVVVAADGAISGQSDGTVELDELAVSEGLGGLIPDLEDLGNAGSGITDGEVDTALELKTTLLDQVVDLSGIVVGRTLRTISGSGNATHKLNELTVTELLSHCFGVFFLVGFDFLVRKKHFLFEVVSFSFKVCIQTRIENFIENAKNTKKLGVHTKERERERRRKKKKNKQLLMPSSRIFKRN